MESVSLLVLVSLWGWVTLLLSALVSVFGSVLSLN